MKKKNVKLVVLLGFLLTAFLKQSTAQADITPTAAPAQPITAPAPTIQSDPPSEETKVDYNASLVPESQFFQYGCLNAANVTLRTLQKMDCDLLRRIYNENPQRAVDQLSLLILVQRVLEGADVRNMPEQDRVNLAYATILGEIRKYGRTCEVRDYMGLGYGDCKGRLIIPSIAALCQVLEGVKGAILLELYHYKMIFPAS